MEKHQQSEKHQKFISDNANFIGLDTLINEGTNIESFLKLHANDGKSDKCMVVGGVHCFCCCSENV